MLGHVMLWHPSVESLLDFIYISGFSTMQRAAASCLGETFAQYTIMLEVPEVLSLQVVKPHLY